MIKITWTILVQSLCLGIVSAGMKSVVANQLAVTRKQLPVTREQLPVTREQLPVTREQLPVTREQLPVTREHLAVTREQLPVTREHLAVTREQLPVSHRRRYGNGLDTPLNGRNFSTGMDSPVTSQDLGKGQFVPNSIAAQVPGKARLQPGKVWVIGSEAEGIAKSKPAQVQPFNWVVEDPQNIGQQPLLQIAQKKQSTPKKPASQPKKDDNYTAFEKLVKDTQKLPGLFTLYRDEQKNKVYLEIQPTQLKKNYLATATLESGIGESGIYSGMPLQDFLFYFERVNNNLQFVVRNVNFRIREGDPQGRSLSRSFSDSVLYTLKIKSIHPTRKSILIELNDLLLKDLAGVRANLGISGSTKNSYFGSAKAFPHNVEIESVLNFSSNKKKKSFGTLADSRGYTLRVHYSLFELPNNDYTPRLADERVGYFITAYQDLSNDNNRDPFVRYINRWHLEKLNPKAAISRPKAPIVFWIDNAVPVQYRDSIREGVLMWNKAFEAAGFKDAIQVRQMPDDASWDPGDIRYNTIRWINTVDGNFAMGPSRVNPLTGQIINASILMDATFVRSLKNDYRQIVQPSTNNNRSSLSAIMQNRLVCAQGLQEESEESEEVDNEQFLSRLSTLAGEYDLCYGMEAANQYAFGSMALQMLRDITPTSEKIKEYTHQYLKLIIAHEVGHTLGLRHNFRGSTLLSPEEMNDTEVTRTRGLVSSVMDYIPPNIAPEGVEQGDYFPRSVGVYDIWAIKYGYTPTGAASPIAEKPFLDKIASQSDQPGLSYATDEDVYDLDPTADAWDNSSNVLVYSQLQMEKARKMWEKINTRYPVDGESYSDVRNRFAAVLSNYFQQVYYTSKYIGGQSFYRVKAGNSEGRLPFEPVSVEKQRQALEMLQKYIFAEDAFDFPPELLNKLAPSRWRHWGSKPQTGRLDYPIHEFVLFMQSLVLRDLLSGDRLSRLKDIEIKSPPGEVLTLPELFDTLQQDIWTEVIEPKDKEIKITSLRRGLQRQYLKMLTDMVLRKKNVPEDARTLAWYKLKQLNEKLEDANSQDQYTLAHLMETRDRIQKVLDAPLQAN